MMFDFLKKRIPLQPDKTSFFSYCRHSLANKDFLIPLTLSYITPLIGLFIRQKFAATDPSIKKSLPPFKEAGAQVMATATALSNEISALETEIQNLPNGSTALAYANTVKEQLTQELRRVQEQYGAQAATLYATQLSDELLHTQPHLSTLYNDTAATYACSPGETPSIRGLAASGPTLPTPAAFVAPSMPILDTPTPLETDALFDEAGQHLDEGQAAASRLSHCADALDLAPETLEKLSFGMRAFLPKATVYDYAFKSILDTMITIGATKTFKNHNLTPAEAKKYLSYIPVLTTVLAPLVRLITWRSLGLDVASVSLAEHSAAYQSCDHTAEDTHAGNHSIQAGNTLKETIADRTQQYVREATSHLQGQAESAVTTYQNDLNTQLNASTPAVHSAYTQEIGTELHDHIILDNSGCPDNLNTTRQLDFSPPTFQSICNPRTPGQPVTIQSQTVVIAPAPFTTHRSDTACTQTNVQIEDNQPVDIRLNNIDNRCPATNTLQPENLRVTVDGTSIYDASSGSNARILIDHNNPAIGPNNDTNIQVCIDAPTPEFTGRNNLFLSKLIAVTGIQVDGQVYRVLDLAEAAQSRFDTIFNNISDRFPPVPQVAIDIPTVDPPQPDIPASREHHEIPEPSIPHLPDEVNKEWDDWGPSLGSSVAQACTILGIDAAASFFIPLIWGSVKTAIWIQKMHSLTGVGMGPLEGVRDIATTAMDGAQTLYNNMFDVIETDIDEALLQAQANQTATAQGIHPSDVLINIPEEDEPKTPEERKADFLNALIQDSLLNTLENGNAAYDALENIASTLPEEDGDLSFWLTLYGIKYDYNLSDPFEALNKLIQFKESRNHRDLAKVKNYAITHFDTIRSLLCNNAKNNEERSKIDRKLCQPLQDLHAQTTSVFDRLSLVMSVYESNPTEHLLTLSRTLLPELASPPEETNGLSLKAHLYTQHAKNVLTAVNEAASRTSPNMKDVTTALDHLLSDDHFEQQKAFLYGIASDLEARATRRQDYLEARHLLLQRIKQKFADTRFAQLPTQHQNDLHAVAFWQHLYNPEHALQDPIDRLQNLITPRYSQTSHFAFATTKLGEILNHLAQDSMLTTMQFQEQAKRLYHDICAHLKPEANWAKLELHLNLKTHYNIPNTFFEERQLYAANIITTNTAPEDLPHLYRQVELQFAQHLVLGLTPGDSQLLNQQDHRDLAESISLFLEQDLSDQELIMLHKTFSHLHQFTLSNFAPETRRALAKLYHRFQKMKPSGNVVRNNNAIELHISGNTHLNYILINKDFLPEDATGHIPFPFEGDITYLIAHPQEASNYYLFTNRQHPPKTWLVPKDTAKKFISRELPEDQSFEVLAPAYDAQNKGLCLPFAPLEAKFLGNT